MNEREEVFREFLITLLDRHLVEERKKRVSMQSWPSGRVRRANGQARFCRECPVRTGR